MTEFDASHEFLPAWPDPREDRLPGDPDRPQHIHLDSWGELTTLGQQRNNSPHDRMTRP